MYALRITGIPASTTALQLSEAMGQDPNSISLTPTTAQKPPSTQTATISFSRENAANRAQQTLRAALPHKTRLGENPNIDLDFHGLTVLSASRNDTVEYASPGV